MNFRKIIIPIVAVTILFSSCTSVKPPIQLGFVGGLTGSGSNLGVDGMYGALLAVEVINAQGGVMGRNIELIIKNDQNSPEQALIVDQELLDSGCNLIIGHMISSVAVSAVPYINENNALLVSPTIAKDDLSMIDDHFIRVIPSNITQANLLSVTISQLDIENLGILYSTNNTLFANTFINAIDNRASDSKTKIGASVSFDVDEDLDYEQLVTGLKALDINDLLIIASGDEVAEFAQFFNLLSYYPQVFLPAWAMTNDLIIKGGKTVDGFYGVNYIQLDSLSPDYLQFEAIYKEEHGSYPSFSAIMAYESVMLVVHAMKSVQSEDPMEIKAEITENNSYHGVFGDLIIDQYGDANRQIDLFRISDGQFEMVQP